MQFCVSSSWWALEKRACLNGYASLSDSTCSESPPRIVTSPCLVLFCSLSRSNMCCCESHQGSHPPASKEEFSSDLITQIYVCESSMYVHARSWEVQTKTAINGNCKLLSVCWELDLSSPQEQQVLSTTVSIYPLNKLWLLSALVSSLQSHLHNQLNMLSKDFIRQVIDFQFIHHRY